MIEAWWLYKKGDPMEIYTLLPYVNQPMVTLYRVEAILFALPVSKTIN
jgi:hypothetical protein